jgi:6-phosphofructokinase 1
MSEVKRIGVLTGGGDAPGLTPALKELVYRASEHCIEVVGLYDGWRGLLDPLPEATALGQLNTVDASTTTIRAIPFEGHRYVSARLRVNHRDRRGT